MECAKTRKLLKEYANDEISDKEERREMETHISGCPVCKRELLLWQEVMDKQRAVGRMQAGMPKELKDRIKHRMTNNQKAVTVSPVVKKLQALSGKASLITLFVLICVALLFLTHYMRFKGTIIGPILIFSGFAVLFLLLLFRGPKKP